MITKSQKTMIKNMFTEIENVFLFYQDSFKNKEVKTHIRVSLGEAVINISFKLEDEEEGDIEQEDRLAALTENQ